MKRKTRPLIPLDDELLIELGVETYGEILPAVHKLKEQNETYQRGLEATKRLTDKIAAQLRTERLRKS